MEIKLTSSINRFFKNATDNILSENWGEKIPLTSKNKKEWLNKLKEYTPSLKTLYLDSSTYTDNPYNKNIKLSPGEYGEFELQLRTIKKDVLTRITWLEFDPKKEFNDYFRYGAYKRSIPVPVLIRGSEIWMSPTLAEQTSIDPYAKKASGRVLTFGLGLGYFPYMCHLNPNVESVTVVELSQDVINFFNSVIHPQFPQDFNLDIIQGDALDYFNDEFLSQFDYVFVDIWKTNEDGLYWIEKLLSQTKHPQADNLDFWIETSAFMTCRMLMFLYFKSLAEGKVDKLLNDFKHKNKQDYRQFCSFKAYFESLDLTVTEPSILQDFIYDTMLMRQLLADSFQLTE